MVSSSLNNFSLPFSHAQRPTWEALLVTTDTLPFTLLPRIISEMDDSRLRVRNYNIYPKMLIPSMISHYILLKSLCADHDIGAFANLYCT